MSNKNKDFGRRLRELRLSRGITAQDLADRVGVHFTSISKYERGENYPKMDVVDKIALVLNVKKADLFGDEVKVEGLDGADPELIQKAKDLGLEWIAITKEIKEKGFTVEDLKIIIQFLELNKRKK